MQIDVAYVDMVVSRTGLRLSGGMQILQAKRVEVASRRLPADRPS